MQTNHLSKSKFCSGKGDSSVFEVLNTCWEMSSNDSKGKHNLTDLINKDINSFWEGEAWKGIWSQNYIGMYTWTPIISDSLFTYHLNAYKKLFDFQGDGKKKDFGGFVAPAGAIPEYISYRDGKEGIVRYKVDEYIKGTGAYEDFWVEGTAAMVYCFSDLLLAMRDKELIGKYLSKIELSLNWLHSLITENGLMATGPAGTLIEREYGATYLGNLKYEKGYPSGAMVYYIGALEQASELEKFCGAYDKSDNYISWTSEAKMNLKKLITSEEYFINYIDSLGKLHGVYGEKEHGYFESNPNHDAIALRIVDEETSKKIYKKIKSIPNLLNKDGQIRCVYPTHDDCMPNNDHEIYTSQSPMYNFKENKWTPMHEHGPGVHWNGGVWFSSEARMIMAQYILDEFSDVIKPLKRHIELSKEGKAYDQMNGDGNMDYYSSNGELHPMLDFFEVPGAALRGLFEYRYYCDRLRLYPHIYPEIEEYTQNYPVRFGEKKIYISVNNSNMGRIQNVNINGEKVKNLNDRFIDILYNELPLTSKILMEM